MRRAPETSAAKLPAVTAILDGEMVATDNDGKTNVRAFRQALEWHPDSLSFIDFDLLDLDGKDMRQRPLTERRAKLWELVQLGTGAIQ